MRALRTTVAVLCILLPAALAGCVSQTQTIVYAVAKTKVYHRRECAIVRMAKAEPMTRTAAQEAHFIPCPACQPDEQ